MPRPAPPRRGAPRALPLPLLALLLVLLPLAAAAAAAARAPVPGAEQRLRRLREESARAKAWGEGRDPGPRQTEEHPDPEAEAARQHRRRRLAEQPPQIETIEIDDDDPPVPKAASASAAGADDDTPSGGPRRYKVAREYVVFWKTGVLGLKDTTHRLRLGVGKALAADATVQAKVASGGGAMATPTLAKMALHAPFEVASVTPFEVDTKGKPVPFAFSLIRLDKRLAGKKAAVDITEHIIARIRENPDVIAVMPHYLGHRSAQCGPTVAVNGWGPNTKCADNTQCCRGTDNTCGAGDAYCGDACSAEWGAPCIDPMLFRKGVMNAAAMTPDKVNNLYQVEAMSKKLVGKIFRPAVPYIFRGNVNNNVAMVIDTGVGPHDDINVVKCYRFTHPAPAGLVHDGVRECYDNMDGHGTHVAGILASKNNGRGNIGVMEGFPIYAAHAGFDEPWKLNMISTIGMFDAIRSIITSNNADKIAVVNMSLGAFYDLFDPDEKLFVEGACGLMTDLELDYGIASVTAASNDADPLDIGNDAIGRTYFPAVCQATIVVTALKTCAVKKWPSGVSGRQCDPRKSSNWLIKESLPHDLARTFAAPGGNIYSTLPNNKYGLMSGTSMATPHVSGVVARCFASGDCVRGDYNNPTRVINIMTARSNDPAYWWNGADAGMTTIATSIGPDQRWYGRMAWAGHW